MRRTLIVNTRVISPDLDLPDAAVLIEGGRIVSVNRREELLADAEVQIDAAGALLMPGFIDLHAHGADGADVGYASLDSLRHIAACKLREGVTTWLPTTLTLPPEQLASIAESVADFRQEGGPIRCPGVHLEGPFIDPLRAGAQNPEFARLPDWEEVAALQRIAPVRILSLAPELPGALDLIRRCREQGIVCSAAHTSATSAEILAACDAGLTHLTHFGNAMTALHHREIGAVGRGLIEPRLMLELICDLVHLSPDMLRLVATVVPLERLMLVTDSVAASWHGDGEMQLGGLAVIVKDGIARLKEGGALAGSTLRANEGFRHLARTTGLPLERLVAATSWNQARSLGLKGLGRIEPGFLADLVLLDDDFRVVTTFVGGEER